MRQFLGLLFVVLFGMPLGLSVVGCGRKGVAAQYCSGNLEAGFQVGQLHNITLAQNLSISGESLNYGQIGTSLTASGTDCIGNAVNLTSFTFSSQDPSIADINPANGTVCGGKWNRNSGGGIGDFTVCTPPAATNTKHVTYVYAQSGGVTSNAIAVYIHAPVTAVQLGSPTDISQCSSTSDPATNCCVFNSASSSQTPVQVTNGYDQKSCISQNTNATLVARVYDAQRNNITCQVGPVAFSLQGATNIATINAQGIVTASQPGSALVTATVSNSSSALNSGYFSTCPPQSITLTAVNQPTSAPAITVGLNTTQSFTANVLDTKGATITGLNLEFNSTLPVNFPTSSGAVTPAFPGSATITAVCNPPTCNPAPFSQIGLNGNGKPITSNGITVTANGTSASVIYMASTPSTATAKGTTVTNAGSQYIVSEDFTTGTLGSPIKLPFVPNSMVISQDGTTLYLGSQQGLMTVTTATNSVTNTFNNIQGTVLAVAPNNSYAVVSDSSRQTISLVTSTGSVFSTFNGTGTRAQWTPDSDTLYVLSTTRGATDANATQNQLLTYSTFLGWQATNLDSGLSYSDLAITVPSVGAYFAANNGGTAYTDGRSYCPNTTLTATTVTDPTTGITTTQTPVATNAFYPLADRKPVQTDRLAATTDGKHILGATATALQDLTVTLPIGACPQPPATQVTPGFFQSSPATHALTAITPAVITSVVASSDSATAFVTYTGLGGILPLYQPSTGVVSNIPLAGGATAPVSGVFSSDNTTFYTGTSGDNLVHIISVNGPSSKDSGTIAPNLLDPNGGIATPNLIAQRVRRTTS